VRFLDSLEPGRLGGTIRAYDLTKLESWITPTLDFFVRNHFGVPLVRDHRLEVRGRVQQPGLWTVDRMKKLPRREAVVTLECAGNSLVQRQGLVSTAHFAGTSLKALLAEVRPLDERDQIVFRGADQPFEGATETYARSIALEEAVARRSLLAWEMNGEPLRPDHGAPLRLVVPGWYGMASVKWLTAIELSSERFAGRFQDQLYVNRVDTADGNARLAPVTRLELKSVVASAEPRGGRIRFRGAAWGEEGLVRRVSVSFDLGKSWVDAVLESQTAPGAWRLWHVDWRPRPGGKYSIASRAFGSGDTAQPLVRDRALADAPYARNEVWARPIDVECP
jgi:DMSO/TMAO reductase YedYZ molybdopterin-dependent catalytic subunit